MDTSDSSTTPDSPAPRALISRIYYHSIGTLVPNGTSIRCSMTGNTTSDAYGNTVWASLSSHSSRLNSGYGTDWTETDFSYDLIDGRRTYVCHFIGTLEEPYKQSGFIEYYVYSEGWDIWFETIELTTLYYSIVGKWLGNLPAIFVSYNSVSPRFCRTLLSNNFFISKISTSASLPLFPKHPVAFLLPETLCCHLSAPLL